jgi:hypothetical protein
MIPCFPLLGWCVALGGSTALDTVGSQAFTGGSRRTDLGIHFQRCLVLLWILLLPPCALWAFIEPVLLTLGQPHQLSKDVQKFLRILIIGAPGYIAFETLKKYLQSQGELNAYMYLTIRLTPFRHHGSIDHSTGRNVPHQLVSEYMAHSLYNIRPLRITACPFYHILGLLLPSGYIYIFFTKPSS